MPGSGPHRVSVPMTGFQARSRRAHRKHVTSELVALRKVRAAVGWGCQRGAWTCDLDVGHKDLVTVCQKGRVGTISRTVELALPPCMS